MLDLHALAPCYVFYFLLICPLFSFGFWKIGLFADACLCLGMLMPQDLCTTVPLHNCPSAQNVLPLSLHLQLPHHHSLLVSHLLSDVCTDHTINIAAIFYTMFSLLKYFLSSHFLSYHQAIQF